MSLNSIKNIMISLVFNKAPQVWVLYCFFLVFPAISIGCKLPKNIEGYVELSANCVYKASLLIVQSNVVIDCNGGILDGENELKYGLLIDSMGSALENVTVKNCTFRNFKNGGVLVTWSGVAAQKSGTRAEKYAKSPHNIILDNNIIQNNGGVGVYVDDYVAYTYILNSLVQGNRGVGVYLDDSTKNNILRNNTFINNGYRLKKGPREALAIDSSADNIIEGNTFSSNAAGAIFLYKNCGENIHKGRQVIRWQHSDRNIIHNNIFYGELIGVWLASRQSKNMATWDCGDLPMDPMGRYFEDFADDNTVSGNKFIDNKVAIRVESDRNQIIANDFFCVRNPIEFPITRREEFLGLPQTGNVMRNNRILSCR